MIDQALLARTTQLLRENSMPKKIILFGSHVRSDAREDSDIDILVDLDPGRPIGVFGYARLKLYIGALLGGPSDVVNRKMLKPLLRDNVLRECVNAF